MSTEAILGTDDLATFLDRRATQLESRARSHEGDAQQRMVGAVLAFRALAAEVREAAELAHDRRRSGSN